MKSSDATGGVQLSNAGVKVISEQIRQRPTSKVPKVLGRTFARDEWPLRNLTVEAAPGEVLAIFDSTGHRESLLLRLMSGRIKPDEGTVASPPRAALVSRQRRRDVRSLSLGQTIHLVSGLMGMTDSEIRERSAEIAAMAGVSRKLVTSTEESEMFLVQQILFSAAVMMPVPVFAFDRTLPIGSPDFRKNALPRIDRLRDGGATVIAHIQLASDIRRFADKGLFLDGDSAVVLPRREFAREVVSSRRARRRKLR